MMRSQMTGTDIDRTTDEATGETTDETTSHLTRLSKDDSQVIGYSHPTGETTSHSTRLSTNDNQVSGYKQPKDGCQVVGYSHSAKPPNNGGQAAGNSHLTRHHGLGEAMLGRCMMFVLLLACLTTSHAADFVLEDIQGRTHRLADYRGKWVLVNFWATWCSPCLSEIPQLSSLHNAHKDKDLLVIGIAMQSGSRKEVADFAQAHRISYPVVLGDFKSARQIGAVDVLPSSYLYNTKGELVSYQAGEVTRAGVETYIQNK
jgi:peroxiredoxin